MSSGIGEMIQAQRIQHKPNDTPSAQVGCREFYSDFSPAALMGNAQFYTESVILRTWGKFQIS